MKQSCDVWYISSPVDIVGLSIQIKLVQEAFPEAILKASQLGLFQFAPSVEDIAANNQDSRSFADAVFKKSTLQGDTRTFHGGNSSNVPVAACIQGETYILPPQCSFYCQDISTLSRDSIQECQTGFNLVIIDPPWWNKYIRRRKANNQRSSYSMMRNEDIADILLQSLLAPDALVAVWCTNSSSHITDVRERLFPKWGLEYVSTWFWLKVDRSGTPVCNFSPPPGKQPFERIIFGRHRKESTSKLEPPEGKILISIPSAIHSHKPPLLDVLKSFVSEPCKVLELFARSLLPGAVSWGLEVLKLQHESLFCCKDKSEGAIHDETS